MLRLKDRIGVAKDRDIFIEGTELDVNDYKWLTLELCKAFDLQGVGDQ